MCRTRAILAIKLAHSVIFWILSACVLAIVEGAVAAIVAGRRIAYGRRRESPGRDLFRTEGEWHEEVFR